MTFELPAPDLAKIIAAWEEFEAGEQAPGRVLANMKTAGLPRVLGRTRRAGLDAVDLNASDARGDRRSNSDVVGAPRSRAPSGSSRYTEHFDAPWPTDASLVGRRI